MAIGNCKIDAVNLMAQMEVQITMTRSREASLRMFLASRLLKIAAAMIKAKVIIETGCERKPVIAVEYPKGKDSIQ
jgi:hypothetical protein